MSGFDRIPTPGSYRVKAGSLGSFMVPDQTSTYVNCTTSSTYTIPGTWTALTSSTPYAALLTSVTMTVTTTGYLMNVQIGVGAAGAEVVVFSQGWYTGQVVPVTWTLPVPVYVPAGSRVALRGSSGGGALAIYGWCSMVPTASLETY